MSPATRDALIIALGVILGAIGTLAVLVGVTVAYFALTTR